METPRPTPLPEYIEIHLTYKNLKDLYVDSEGQQKVLKIPICKECKKNNTATYSLIIPYSRYVWISVSVLNSLKETLEKYLTKSQYCQVYVVSVDGKENHWCGIELHITAVLDKSIENN